MPRSPIPSWFIVLVVVRDGDRFLAVHEASHGERWYLPAGRVEPGERLADAALRETLEETGLRVALDGIIRVEHGLSPGGGARVRVVFTARPLDAGPPKSAPDAESLEARWVTLDQLEALSLRHEEVRTFFSYVAHGGPVFPLEVLADEGSPLSALARRGGERAQKRPERAETGRTMDVSSRARARVARASALVVERLGPEDRGVEKPAGDTYRCR